MAGVSGHWVRPFASSCVPTLRCSALLTRESVSSVVVVTADVDVDVGCVGVDAVMLVLMHGRKHSGRGLTGRTESLPTPSHPANLFLSLRAIDRRVCLIPGATPWNSISA